jgi:hypothetical protein
LSTRGPLFKGAKIENAWHEQESLMSDRLEELFARLPEFAQQRLPVPVPVGWDAVHAELGTALPKDFRDLMEQVAFHEFDNFLVFTHTHHKAPGDSGIYVDVARNQLTTLQDLAESGDSEGYRAFPEPGGLLPWADSLEGDMFFWDTTEDDPDRWTVVVASRNGSWLPYDGGMVAFLLRLADEGSGEWELPPNLFQPKG